MLAVRRRTRKIFTWLIYAISFVALYPVIISFVDNIFGTTVGFHLPFEDIIRIYFSWIVLIMGGVLLLRLRKNTWVKLSAVLLIGIGVLWFLFLLLIA